MQEKQKVCGGGSCHRQPRFSFSLASGFSVLLPVYAYMLYATLFIHSVFSLNFPRSSCPGLYVPCQLCLLAFLLLLHSIFTPIKRRKREEDPPLVMQAVYVMTSELPYHPISLIRTLSPNPPQRERPVKEEMVQQGPMMLLKADIR